MERDRKDREFDVLLWGVTGWTGIHLLEYFVKKYPLDGSQKEVNWAVVARNEKKLDTALQQVAEDFKAPWLNEVQKFLVDNDDEEKIREVVPLSKGVATVVGPYGLFGMKLAKVCAEIGTHYADITGEAPFVRKMIDNYEESAKKSGIFMVPFAGCDSIPSDYTTFKSISKLNATICEKYNLEDVSNVEKSFKSEGYLTALVANNRKSKDASPGGGTAASIVAIMEQPRSGSAHPYILTSRDDPCKNDLGHNPQMTMWRGPEELGDKRWTTPFFMAVINEKVVRRSRFLLPSVYGTDFSYHEAMAVSSPLSAFAVSAGTIGAVGLLAMSFTRNRLKSYLPQPSQSPPRMSTDGSYKPGKFEFVNVVRGTYRFEDGKSESLTAKTTFFAPDEVAYTFTSVFLAEVVLTLVKHEEDIKKMSGLEGGVVTSACLGDLLGDRLMASDVEIKVELCGQSKI